jgi:hypothetical protein
VADYAIPAAIVEARVTAAEGRTATAAATLKQALADAQRLQHVQLQMEARLALATVSRAGAAELEALARDASERGYRLVARQARQLASGK